MPSSSFNRHPLSDTPLVSKSNSPLQHPVHDSLLPPISGVASGSLSCGSYSPPNGLDPTTQEATTSAHSSDNDDHYHHHHDHIHGSGYTSPLHLPLRRTATTLDVPGLTRTKFSPDGAIAAQDVEAKLVIVMVGLPARGKSYVTNKLCRYLNWQQHGTKIFNVGNKRRSTTKKDEESKGPLADNEHDIKPNVDQKDGSTASPVRKNQTSQPAEFFSPDNPESFGLREQWAMDTLEDLLDYVLEGPGSVGILDATNTTIARRRNVLDRIKERSGGRLKVLFLESICSNSAIIEANIRMKLSGPDYKDVDTDVAIKDFVSRMHNYEKVYQTIGPEEEANDEFQYIKMIDVGRKVVCCNINGFLAGQAVFFLLNFNLADRQIWITRHGESEDNFVGRIGGDAPLTENGRKFAKAAARFMSYQKTEFHRRQIQRYEDRERILHRSDSEPATPTNEPEEPNFCLWTSMMKRSLQTAEYFSEDVFDIKEMRMLNELGAGICDGMTYSEIQAKYPQEYAARMADKVQYRYPGPGGESYLDVINRLRAVIVEVERMVDNALIIAHRVVCRVLLAYFMNLGRDAIGDLDVPLHTLYCLEPNPYGVSWEVYEYDEATDWFKKVSKEMLKKKATQRSTQNKALRERQYSVVATAMPPDLAKQRLPTVNDITLRLEKMSNRQSSSHYEPDRGQPL